MDRAPSSAPATHGRLRAATNPAARRYNDGVSLRRPGAPMRSWFPQRPLSGPEVVGIVVVAFVLLPFLIGGFLALVLAISTWPAVIGLVAGSGGAVLVHWTLTQEVIANRRRISELEHENAVLHQQVRALTETV